MLVADSLTQKTIIVAGVDTHKDTHHVAVTDLLGAPLADREFPVTTAGYEKLLAWVAGHGVIDRIAVELTGSYGAGLTRFLTQAGVTVVEVNTTDKATRAKQGKDDRIDAYAAARKAISGMATAIPKDTTGPIESIRMLTIVRTSAVRNRTQALNQIKDLLITAPASLREQFAGKTLPASADYARAFRPDRSRLTDPIQAAKRALKRLGERIDDLNEEITAADKELADLVGNIAPTLLSRPRIGTHIAAQLLITTASNIGRIRSEAALARICGIAPVPISSGKTNRVRLHRGGDRQANRAVHMIVIGRLAGDPATKAYMAKRIAEGKSKRDTIRALKRFVIRQIHHDLVTDLGHLDKS